MIVEAGAEPGRRGTAERGSCRTRLERYMRMVDRAHGETWPMRPERNMDKETGANLEHVQRGWGMSCQCQTAICQSIL